MRKFTQSSLVFGISETTPSIYSVEEPLFADAYKVVSDWHDNYKGGSVIYLPYDPIFAKENKGMPIHWVTRPIRTEKTTLLIGVELGSNFSDAAVELKEFIEYIRKCQLWITTRYYVYHHQAGHAIASIVNVDPVILKYVEIHYGHITEAGN